MYRNITYALEQVDSAKKPIGVDAAFVGSDHKCKPELYAGVFSQFENMHEKLKTMTENVRLAYMQKVSEQLAMLEFAKIKEQEGKNVNKEQFNSMNRER